MGLFRPYERASDDEASPTTKLERRKALTPSGKAKPPKPQPTQDTHAEPSEALSATRVVTRQPQKKQTATRSRKQAEAERMERLHPSRTPREQRKADRAANVQARAQAWEQQENSKERVLLRNYLDSRWTLTEFLLPAMILIMVGVMATASWPVLSSAIALGLWALLLASFIEIFIKWRSYKRLLAERAPGTSTRGLLMYMYNRAMMIRRFRRPSPAIERGAII
ncbi:MAG: DUF3043 domain-containing protein [Arachnia sp.]